MSNEGTIVDANTVKFERVLPGPIAQVWAYLVRPENVTKWLASAATIELRVGGRVELKMGHGGKVPDAVKKQIVDADNVGPTQYGVVTRLEEPRVLAYTWNDKPSSDAAAGSEVSFELTPQGSDVLLTLTHRRVPSAFIPQVAAGWHTLLDTLGALHGHEPTPDFFARFQEVLPRYASATGG